MGSPENTPTETETEDRDAVLEREADFWTVDAREGGFARIRPWINKAIGEFSRDEEFFRYFDAKGKDVLDYGCGDGRIAVRLASDGARKVTGFDISEGQIEAARRSAQAKGVADRTEFLVADAHATGFPDDSFDLVVGVAILHHLDLAEALHEIRRILRPGGRAVFTEPLQHNPLLRLGRKLTPGARTPDEHPLTVEDWALCASIFPGFKHTEQEFVTIPLMPLNLVLPESARKPLARRAIRADQAALRKFPSVRKYARTTFLILE
jgi:ubiquinone/menaquinone biosynthesis C-methylase UbiE